MEPRGSLIFIQGALMKAVLTLRSCPCLIEASEAFTKDKQIAHSSFDAVK